MHEHNNTYVFVRDMGKITFNKIEFDCFSFDLHVNNRDENLSTTQKSAKAYRKMYLRRELGRKKNELSSIQLKIKQMELAITIEANVI